MFPQVSKISPTLFFFFVVLFQQFAVGSTSIEDTVRKAVVDTVGIRPESSIITADTLAIADNETSDDALQSQVKYHAADSIRVDIDGQIVYLYGKATVDYQDLHLQADYIVIDMDNKELYAKGTVDSTGETIGSPEFSQADQKFRSQAIRYNFDTKKGKISYVITQEGEGYIHGDVVKKDPENNFFIKNGQYTTCNLDTPHFSIIARKLKVISKNKIITGPAFLSIEQVPTPLIIPFGFFPNKKGRSSGIIFPAFGESTQRGFYFQRLGYYFGFSDYFNLAATTDIYTKGSYTLDLASAYKKRYKYDGTVRLSYASTVNSEKELSDYSVRKDFHIYWTHSKDSKANPNSSFSANVNAGTSTYYQNTISSVNNFLSNTFQSSVSYSYNFPDKPINYGVSVNHTQNILTRDLLITAPDLSLNVSRITPFKRKESIGRQKWYEKIGVNYSMRASNSIQTKDTLLFTSGTLENMRNGMQHSIPINTSFNVLKYLNFSPSLSFTERWYFKTTQYAWDSENRKVDTLSIKNFEASHDYSVSAALTTRIYGMYQFKKGPIVAVRHVMTPSVSFTYRPDFSEEKYGYYKRVQTDTAGHTALYSIFQSSIYGGPSSGKFANIGYSLDNNLEMKVKTNADTGATTKKIKLFESLRLSGGYNLIADSLKLSPVSFSGRTSLLDRFFITFGGVLDPYAFDTNNTDYNRFLYDVNGKFARLTSGNAALNFSLNKTHKAKTSSKYSQQEVDYINSHPEEYVDFEIPYNLTVSYIFSYSKRGSLASVRNQSASMNGDVSLTPQLKIGFNSWYDITNGKFTNFGLNIYRDLHCWEMRMNWIPFGYQESWNFQINVKASILQDLKLLKRKDFYDQ